MSGRRLKVDVVMLARMVIDNGYCLAPPTDEERDRNDWTDEAVELAKLWSAAHEEERKVEQEIERRARAAGWVPAPWDDDLIEDD